MFFSAQKNNKEFYLFQFALAVVPVTILLTLLLWTSGGVFTYTLDDPYIHLALAKNIFLGNYGINLSEVSAPSSSIVWPFLLAPFYLLGNFFEYIPFLINLLCLCTLVQVMSSLFSGVKTTVRFVLIAAIAISLNLYGLVFTGMEHSLQVLLVALIIFPILKAVPEKVIKIPTYAWLAIVMLPLVRYEGLAISLPVLAYLFAKGEKNKAATAFAAITLSLLAFSYYLYSKGLGILPSSVLAKSSHNGLTATVANLRLNIKTYGFLLIPVGMMIHFYWNKERLLGFVLLAVTCLHFVFGQFGWFGRYENYYLIFIILIGARILIDIKAKLLPTVFLLPLAFASLVNPTFATPLAAANIFNQQGQMARLAQLLGEPVAVNDLGLMALRSDQYVLDLWGLGSIEALRYRLSDDNANWISTLMNKNKVKYAFVYDEWFKSRPLEWRKVGELKLLQKRVMTSSDRVSLYAVDAASAENLRQAIGLFSQRYPSKDFEVRLVE